MKKHTLATAILAASLGSVAQADITFNIINDTEKPLKFSLMVPRTKTYSNLEDGHVASGQTGHFPTSQILTKCAGKSWRCSKLKAVVQQWGKYVVFVECPKVYNSRRSKSLWYKISGNDSAYLFCRRVNKPKPKVVEEY